MTRWIMLALTVFGFALAIMTSSPGLLGLGLLLGLIGLFGVVFGLIADRVAAATRPETSMLGSEELAHMSGKARGRASERRVPPPGR